MLIVDVEETPAPTLAQEWAVKKTKEQLHFETQRTLIDAAERYKYEIGLSEEFESPIWKRLDLILKAHSQEEAEKLAAEAQEFGLLRICVWHKKVKR